MVDGAMIPAEIWLLVFRFLPKSAYNPIVFTRLSQVCRGARAAFRSDEVWKHVNPYGLARDINNHFTIAMSVLNPEQQHNMFLVWDTVQSMLADKHYARFEDTPIYLLNQNEIPDLAARENDYYNLGLLLCTVPQIDRPRVTFIKVTNKTLLRNAIALYPGVYARIFQSGVRDDDLLDLVLSTDSDSAAFLGDEHPLSTHQRAMAIKSARHCNPLVFLNGTGAMNHELATALVRRCDNYLGFIPTQFRRDRQFLQENIAYRGELYYLAPDDLKDDPEFTRKAVLAGPSIVNMTMDLDLWRLAVWAHPDQGLVHAPPEFLPDLMPKSIERAPNPRGWFKTYGELEGIEDIKRQGVELYRDLAQLWPELVPASRQKILESIKGAELPRYGYMSSVYLPQEYSNDREIVMAAVSKDGRALQYASEAMRDDKEIVLKAVESCYSILEFVSDRLREDKDVVKRALAYEGLNLMFCTMEIKKSREFVKLAVANRGEALTYADDELRADRDLVLRARCSLRPINEKDTYADPFYDQFATDDPYLDMVNQMTMRLGLPPMESEGKSLEYFEFVI